MEATLSKIEERISHFEMYELLIMSAVGIAILFFGYRIKKIAFFLIWFLIGYNLTFIALPLISRWLPDVSSSDFFQLLLPICGGALLALLGFSIEKFCVSMLCFALVMIITVQYFGVDAATLAIGAIIGLISGAVAVKLLKPATIVATAVAGGYTLTIALLNFFPEISKEIFYFPLIGGISLIGTVFQFATTKRVK